MPHISVQHADDTLYSTCLCIFGLYGAIQMLLLLLLLSLLLQMLDVRGILL